MHHQYFAALALAGASLSGSAFAEDLPLTDDAQILQSSPTFNYGIFANLGVTNTAGSQRYSFMRFDVHTSLPLNTRQEDIAQAFLYLYVNTVTTAGKFAVAKVTGPLWMAGTTAEGKANGAASAGTLTWNTANSVATTAYTTVNYTGGLISEYLVIEVTDLVKGWLTAPASSNYGLAIKPTGVAGENVNLQFDSKENATTSHQPFIHVTLDKKRVAPLGDVTMGAFTSGPLP